MCSYRLAFRRDSFRAKDTEIRVPSLRQPRSADESKTGVWKSSFRAIPSADWRFGNRRISCSGSGKHPGYLSAFSYRLSGPSAFGLGNCYVWVECGSRFSGSNPVLRSICWTAPSTPVATNDGPMVRAAPILAHGVSHALFPRPVSGRVARRVRIPGAIHTQGAGPSGILPERVYNQGSTRALADVLPPKVPGRRSKRRSQKRPRGVAAYDLPFAGLLLYTMRHMQHHAAQLNLILRQRTEHAPRWVFRANLTRAGLNA